MAILPIQPRRLDGDTVELFEDLLTNEVSTILDWPVISPAEVRDVLDRDLLRIAQRCAAQTCSDRLRGTLDKRFLLKAKAGRLGAKVFVQLVLIDLREAEVVARSRSSVPGGEEGYEALIRSVVEKLFDNASIPAAQSSSPAASGKPTSESEFAATSPESPPEQEEFASEPPATESQREQPLFDDFANDTSLAPGSIQIFGTSDTAAGAIGGGLGATLGAPFIKLGFAEPRLAFDARYWITDEFDVLSINADLDLVFLSTPRAAWYGIGGVNLNFAFEEFNTTTGIGLNAGLGAEYWILPFLGSFAELKASGTTGELGPRINVAAGFQVGWGSRN